ncbi:MAG TPA: patatin-like phospholipase family protein [bacterium]|mgnify:CR=1 FL=1|nr:patatin-like phospholipase family protein [bacterium]
MFNFIFQKKKRKVSLVLSGGGAKGFFHLGVINAIRSLDIEVVEISGTSIGAIMGTIYASNPSIDFNKCLDGFNFMKFMQLTMHVKREKAVKSLEGLLSQYISVSTFSDLKIPMSFNATNIATGEEVIFRNGDIFPSIISSMAIPFVFPAIKVDNRYLCDGGIVNNLPISLIKTNRNDIIASILGGELPGIRNFNDRISVLTNAYYIMEKENVKRSIMEAKNQKGINLDIIRLGSFMSTFDFRQKNIKELINRGYKAAMRILK